jgi:hypothetical protein
MVMGGRLVWFEDEVDAVLQNLPRRQFSNATPAEATPAEATPRRRRR